MDTSRGVIFVPGVDTPFALERFNCQDTEFSLNYMLAKLDLSYWVRNHDSKLIVDSSTATLETSQLPKKILFLLSLVKALSSNKRIILLDDPTQGMCEHYFSVFNEFLDELISKNKTTLLRTIIIATKNKTLLQKADSLIVIRNNLSCLQGSPKELISKT